MGYVRAISALEDQYARFRGDLDRIEKAVVETGVPGPELRIRRVPDIEAAEAAVDHIAFCLRLFDPNWTSAHIKPIQRRRRMDRDQRNELLNGAYGVLRRAPGAMSTPEVIEALWQRGLVPTADRSAFSARLTRLLRRMEGKTVVAATNRPERWAIKKPVRPARSSVE